MTGNRTRYVVDASVVVKLVVEEPLSDRVDALFDLLARDENTRLFVPDLLYTECANILWKYTNRFGMTANQARANLKRLNSLALDVFPTRPRLAGALRLASRFDISVYDACYVDLSKELKIPLLTADMKLVRKLEKSRTRIKPLDRLEIPSLNSSE